MFAGAGIYAGGGTFQQNYRCYPVSFIDKAHLEEGNKVILPPSALDRLAMLHIDYPMLFKIENKKSKKTTHCGVLEFVADEGMIYIPYWMMQNLLIQEGDVVSIRSATLPKGKFVKLQPHTKDFLDISNPKAVLERTLRNYSCLSVGDAILVPYNNKNYYIDIIEAKPELAVSIVETDCEVDFAPPLDYVEPERLPPKPPTGLGGAPSGAASGKAPAEPEPEPEPEGPMAFAGSGRRLDGKPAGPSAPVPMSRGNSAASMSRTPSNSSMKSDTPAAGAAEGGDKAMAGKVVFGNVPGKLQRPRLGEKKKAGASPMGPSGAPAAAPKEEEKKEEPSFNAFSGKSFKLK